jgi:uncharacterized iron-regulated protein
MHFRPSGRSRAIPRRRGALLVSAAVAVGLAACATARVPEPPPPRPGADVGLAGKIYDVAADSFLTEQDLAARLVGPRFILLGEHHDNPAHHVLQAKMLELLLASGVRPVVAFEMLSTDRAGAIRDCAVPPRCEIDEFRHAVEWDASGWPEWEIYRPVFEVAIGAELELRAADIPGSAMRVIASPSAARSDVRNEWLNALRLDRPFAPSQTEVLEREIRESHCHLLPEALVPTMATAQRARDAHLAMTIERAASTPGTVVVLVAGLGHTRNDRGVPVYFANPAARALTLSVSLVEVERDVQTPAAAAEAYDGAFPFDLVWFTSAVERDDPCEVHRQRLESVGR